LKSVDVLARLSRVPLRYTRKTGRGRVANARLRFVPRTYGRPRLASGALATLSKWSLLLLVFLIGAAIRSSPYILDAVSAVNAHCAILRQTFDAFTAARTDRRWRNSSNSCRDSLSSSSRRSICCCARSSNTLSCDSKWSICCCPR